MASNLKPDGLKKKTAPWISLEREHIQIHLEPCNPDLRKQLTRNGLFVSKPVLAKSG